MHTHLHATDQHVIKYEINLGLSEACEPTSIDGHMELDPETSLRSTPPPNVVRETVSRSEKAR